MLTGYFIPVRVNGYALLARLGREDVVEKRLRDSPHLEAHPPPRRHHGVQTAHVDQLVQPPLVCVPVLVALQTSCHRFVLVNGVVVAVTVPVTAGALAVVAVVVVVAIVV